MAEKLKNSSFDYAQFQKKLLKWYSKSQRDLPWRKTKDPYKILVSEVMLQQTQVDTVIPYYERWVKRFSTVEKLANASLNEVLLLWEGMGYYSRAKHLHEASQEIVNKFNGQIPQVYEKLIQLPGIGPYTAGAIGSIAFNLSVPAIDANVRRILARLFCMNILPGRGQNMFWENALFLMYKAPPSDFNQALMDLGALICLSKNPSCHSCPVSCFCSANIRGLQNDFPKKGNSIQIKIIQAVLGIVINQGRIYIQKRPAQGLFAGLWEFPGGKIQLDEIPKKALFRELQEEMGIDVTIVSQRKTIHHTYTRFRVALFPFLCLQKNKISPTPVAEEFRWILPEELNRFAFPAANRKIINSFQKDTDLQQIIRKTKKL